MSSFQEDLADWSVQKTEGEIAFKLPLAYRMITLSLFAVVAIASLWAIILSADPVKADFGLGGLVVCAFLLYSSLPRELHLDFETRSYRKVFGWGVLSFRQSGPFSDIDSISIRRKGGGENIPSLSATMEFKKAEVNQGFMPLPLDWHLVSTEPSKEPALRKFSKDLAARIKVPFRVPSK